jgi:hypothetical protein
MIADVYRKLCMLLPYVLRMVGCLDLELLLGVFTVYFVFGLSYSRQKTVCRPSFVNEVYVTTLSVSAFAVVKEFISEVGAVDFIVSDDNITGNVLGLSRLYYVTW